MAHRNATLLSLARQGVLTPEMETVARDEGLSPEEVRAELAAGTLIIPANVLHGNLHAVGVGKSLRTKVNANIGNSREGSSLADELEKLRVAVRYGADAVMDLSTGADLDAIRGAIVEHSPLPVGTVPVYEAAARVARFIDLSVDDLFDVVEHQARQGVDFMTIHAGLIRSHLKLVQTRLTGIVSRGGSLLASWMLAHEAENPFYENFDRLLEICARWDVSLSLGDGLRPGCLHDANDAAQFAELKVLGELALRCRAAGVQVMIEGPGHVPLHLIQENVRLEEELCHGAPFYVLGPLVTDVGAGYDHVTSAIGGALAGMYGVAMLCYVTPKEHLGLPDANDVRDGLSVHRIAAHAADVARGVRGARERDDAMARARFRFDWEEQFRLALDGDRARELYRAAGSDAVAGSKDFCTMCGDGFCAMKISRDLCFPPGEAPEALL
jgi:phosphomethylpyrimidine synthase